MTQTFIALDLETTGTEPGNDEIIEVAAVRYENGALADTFNTLTRPARTISPFIQVLTGIKPDELKVAPPFSDIAPALSQFLGSSPLVGHRVSFDISFLKAQGIPVLGPVFDTRELASVLCPVESDHSLASLAKFLGLPKRKAHRALSDTLTTADAFVALLRKLEELDPALLTQMVTLTRGSSWPGAALLSDALARRGFAPATPSACPGLAMMPRPERLGEPLHPRSDSKPLDRDEAVAFFAPGGRLAQTLPGCEQRPQQAQMSGEVAAAFAGRAPLLVEAGTGVGKSLAYLAPAALYAWQNQEPVVAATHTLNLQEQLISQDIPLAVKALGLPEDFRAAVLKGRSNYLCLRRWANATSHTLSPEDAALFLRLLHWMTLTQTGNRGELNLYGTDAKAWDRVCAAGEECHAGGCPHRNNHCYYYRAREAARRAHLLVINHALLLSDLATGGQVVPEYRHLIIDEAHNLEEEATKQFGFRLSNADLADFLGRARLSGASPRPSHRPRRRIAEAGVGLDGCLAELATASSRAKDRGEAFYPQLRKFLEAHTSEQGSYERWVRLTRAVRAQPDWQELDVSLESLRLSLQDVEAALGRVQKELEDPTYGDEPQYQTMRDEATSLGQESRELLKWLKEMSSPGAETITWGSIEGEWTALNAAPLQVGPVLQKQLYQKLDTLVLTSATLAIEGSFRHVKERLGLAEAREVLLGTPFDYLNAAYLLAPQDIPLPNRPGYSEALARAMVLACQASQGRALALFTSHSALREAREAISGALAAQDIMVLAQGVDGAPDYLLKRLRAQPKTVILGTSSFWEGVDVAGDALSLLLIARLPFAVPTEPVTAARSEQYGDPFNEYSVPQAVLRFRQGFGRLIRRQGDRGVVIVLDRRLTSTGYGRAFIGSIPPCTIRRVKVADLGREVAGWLGS